MGGSFIPLTRGWRFMQNNAISPTLQYSVQNQYTGITADSSVILRLRYNIAETGGKTSTNQAITWQWSTNQTAWNAPGAAQAWNYGDGLATHGNTLTAFLLSGTTTYGQYIESATSTNYNFAASSTNEFDFAITPGTAWSSGTLYYFRVAINGTGIGPDTANGAYYAGITVTAPVAERRIFITHH